LNYLQRLSIKMVITKLIPILMREYLDQKVGRVLKRLIV
jgi:hypothetical protein